MPSTGSFVPFTTVGGRSSNKLMPIHLSSHELANRTARRESVQINCPAMLPLLSGLGP